MIVRLLTNIGRLWTGSEILSNAARISEPVHRRPMLVSNRTVTGGPPRDW